MFVNLPASLKQCEPGFIHLEPEQIPVWRAPGVAARVVFGSANDVDAAVATPTPGARLVDVQLDPNATFELSLSIDENCFAWLFAGSASSLVPNGAVALRTFDLVGYQTGARRVALTAGADGARIAFCGGPPLNEPVVASGPFVMSTPGQIQDAMAAYRSGAMGHLTRSVYGQDGRPT